MKKAVLYARVSSQLQREEYTIESQVAELKRQIVDVGDVLVKEYIDDGYSGTRLDRPALEQMRTDLKTKLFDTIYFLNADRIARNVTHQTIVIGDILKQKKQLIINGKDYVHNPENNFELTILGAVAELERAKIVERTTRGRRHRLRMGQVASNGHTTYGYQYVKKTPTSPPQLAINVAEAKFVKIIFEMYATGKFGVYRLTRWLEEHGVPTRKGLKLWRAAQIRYMLKNETYAGVRHFNRMTHVKESTSKIRSIRYGKIALRDKSEWISVKVPPIVTRELFDQARERMQQNNSKYRQPQVHLLLSGLLECGECGRGMSSYRRYVGKWLKIGIRRIYHKAAYVCNWRVAERMHARKLIKQCHNPEVITNLLEDKVFEIIKETILDTSKLKSCMDFFKKDFRADQKRVEWKLARLDKKEAGISKQKKRLIDQYAADKLTQQEYVDHNVRLDQDLLKVTTKRKELIKTVPLLHKKEVVDVSIRQFCDSAKARFEKLYDADAKRRFLLDHIEKVIYHRYKVTIVGSVPMKLNAYADPDQTSDASKIGFRIAGEIDKKILHTRPRIKFAEDGRLKSYRQRLGILQTR